MCEKLISNEDRYVDRIIKIFDEEFIDLFKYIPRVKNDSLLNYYFQKGAITLGDSPVLVEHLDQLLKWLGTDVKSPYSSCGILIVGRKTSRFQGDHLSLDFINSIIEKNTEIRIYSQEMFLYSLLVEDIYVNPDKLRSGVLGHPILNQLVEESFTWPTTTLGEGDRPNLVSSEYGLLSYLGYRVGEGRGIPENQRHMILEIIFLEEILGFSSSFDRDYIEKWGLKNSSKRLKKIADSIAYFVRSAKGKGQSHLKAISDWESDLDWLKNKFYIGRFDHDFHWPYS